MSSPEQRIKSIRMFRGREKTPGQPGQERPAGFMKWLNQFNRVAEALAWTDHERCVELPFKLEGEASERYDKLPPVVHSDWKRLVGEMSRFFPTLEDSPQAKRAKFKARRQQKGETIEQLGAALVDLAYTAYPEMDPVARDAEMLDQLRSGIWDTRVQHTLIGMDASALTFQKALEKAIEAERHFKDIKAVRNEGRMPGEKWPSRVNAVFAEEDGDPDGETDAYWDGNPGEPENATVAFAQGKQQAVARALERPSGAKGVEKPVCQKEEPPPKETVSQEMIAELLKAIKGLERAVGEQNGGTQRRSYGRDEGVQQRSYGRNEDQRRPYQRDEFE
jgi:hypothetical protein